ncbi:MAG TPA: TolC family protein [Tepidisphaeraceae bacterium]
MAVKPRIDESMNRSNAWRCSLLFLLLIAGCLPTQQHEVATYRRVLDAHAPTTMPTRIAQTPLTLQDAFVLANRNNEQLGISGEDYVQAIIAKNRAFSAFLPTVNIGPAYSRSHSTDGGSAYRSFTVPVNAGMNLFNGFRDVESLRAATDVIAQRKASLLDAQMTLLLNVTSSYYLVLQSEESAQVLQTSLTYRQEEIRDMKARLRLGNARPLDLAQAQADEASTRASLRQSQTNTINARSELAYLIGVPEITGPLADQFVVPAPLFLEAHFEDLAQNYRQDLISARAAVAAAEEGIKQAIGEYFPTVNINASYFLFNDPEPGTLWTAGISGNIPIFEAGTIEADIRNAWSVARQNQLTESYVSRGALNDVQTAYQNLLNSQDQIVDLEESVVAAQKAFDLADRLYKIGGGSNLDRLTAQNTLLNAQLALTNERFSDKTNYVTLLRVAGLLRPDYPQTPVPTTQPAAVPVAQLSRN